MSQPYLIIIKYASPNVIVPSLRRRVDRRVRLDRCRAACDKSFKIDPSSDMRRCSTVGGCGSVLKPLRVTEVLIVFSLYAITQLLDDLHEAFELGHAEY